MVLITANESVTIIVVVFVVAVLVVDIDIMMVVSNESDLINVGLLLLLWWWTQTSFCDLFLLSPLTASFIATGLTDTKAMVFLSRSKRKSNELYIDSPNPLIKSTKREQHPWLSFRTHTGAGTYCYFQVKLHVTRRYLRVNVIKFRAGSV